MHLSMLPGTSVSGLPQLACFAQKFRKHRRLRMHQRDIRCVLAVVELPVYARKRCYLFDVLSFRVIGGLHLLATE